jgi:hypothetical protein
MPKPSANSLLGLGAELGIDLSYLLRIDTVLGFGVSVRS